MVYCTKITFNEVIQINKHYNTDTIIYFEINNWFSGRDYPDREPFTTKWITSYGGIFNNDAWCKENKLCVVAKTIDMAQNWCITANKAWVLENCPYILSNDTDEVEFKVGTPNGWETKIEKHKLNKFLRFPNEDGTVYGQFYSQFLPYEECNFGVTYEDDDDVTDEVK